MRRIAKGPSGAFPRLEIRATEFTTRDIGDAPLVGETTAESYTLVAADAGRTITVTETATNSAGTGPASATATATPTEAPLGFASPRMGFYRLARNMRFTPSGAAGVNTRAGYVARDFDRQVAEFQVRVALLNGVTALATPITEAVG